MALTEPTAAAGAASTGAPSTGAESTGATSDAAGTPAGLPPAPPVRRRRVLLGSRRRQAVAAVVIAGAVAFLVVQGLGNATQYYKTVPQAVTDRASLGQSQFRIMGTVDNDVRQVSGQTAFSISYAGVTAPVVDKKEPPQLFKPGVPVVLEGHWAGNVFQSDLIMVKHTAVYNPAERQVMSTMPGSDNTGPAAPSK
ncbi:MAG TPA: cytochrome c maturation protein CcmE [Acidimicrobiales bacterium]|nr:cytochrome c maturation protein CcmE [Acidimicrobiales bacterium]